MNKNRVFKNVDYDKFNSSRITDKILRSFSDEDREKLNPMKDILNDITNEIYNSLNEVAPAEKDQMNQNEKLIKNIVEKFLDDSLIKQVRKLTIMNSKNSTALTEEFMKYFMKDLIKQNEQSSKDQPNSKDAKGNNKKEGDSGEQDKSKGNDNKGNDQKSNGKNDKDNDNSENQTNQGNSSNQNKGDSSKDSDNNESNEESEGGSSGDSKGKGGSGTDEGNKPQSNGNAQLNNSEKTMKATSNALDKLRDSIKKGKGNKAEEGNSESKYSKPEKDEKGKKSGKQGEGSGKGGGSYSEVDKYKEAVKKLSKRIKYPDELKRLFQSEGDESKVSSGEINEELDGYNKKKLDPRNLIHTELTDKMRFLEKYANNDLKHKNIISSSLDPVFLVIDNSASMCGDSALISKSIAVSLLNLVNKNGNNMEFYVGFFDDKLTEVFTLNKNRNKTPEDKSFHYTDIKDVESKICKIEPKGGTNILKSVNKAINITKGKLKTIILITDWEDSILNDEVISIKKVLKEKNLRLISIGVKDIVPNQAHSLSEAFKVEVFNQGKTNLSDVDEKDLSRIRINIKPKKAQRT